MTPEQLKALDADEFAAQYDEEYHDYLEDRAHSWNMCRAELMRRLKQAESLVPALGGDSGARHESMNEERQVMPSEPDMCTNAINDNRASATVVGGDSGASPAPMRHCLCLKPAPNETDGACLTCGGQTVPGARVQERQPVLEKFLNALADSPVSKRFGASIDDTGTTPFPSAPAAPLTAEGAAKSDFEKLADDFAELVIQKERETARADRAEQDARTAHSLIESLRSDLITANQHASELNAVLTRFREALTTIAATNYQIEAGKIAQAALAPKSETPKETTP